MSPMTRTYAVMGHYHGLLESCFTFQNKAGPFLTYKTPLCIQLSADSRDTVHIVPKRSKCSRKKEAAFF